MSSANNVVESFRDVVQDLLVPKLKGVNVSVESLHGERGYLRTEMKLSLHSLRQEMKLRNQRNARTMPAFEEKLDYAIDIRERLATLEARTPRQ